MPEKKNESCGCDTSKTAEKPDPRCGCGERCRCGDRCTCAGCSGRKQ